MSAELFEEFSRWQESHWRRSVGEEFADLRAICAEEGGWELPTPERKDRPNSFVEDFADVSS